MAHLFDAAPSNDLPEPERYNVCPTTQIAVVTSDAGSRRLRPMRWGFIPHWYKSPTDGPLLINARSETIAEKPAFRMACRERRCLIPVSGFYEWTRLPDKTRLPWYIHRADGAPAVFAGVWQEWARGDEAFVTCAIVTCESNAQMGNIHHRMPVTLPPDDWALWLGEKGKGAATLMRPAPDETYHAYRVDTAVNSNRASGADLLRPLDAA